MNVSRRIFVSAQACAAVAAFPFPPVRIQRAGEVAGGAVDIDVERVEAGAASVQGTGHDIPAGVDEPFCSVRRRVSVARA